MLPPYIVPPSDSAAIAALTDYAVQTRYPDNYGDTDEVEWREATVAAQRAIDWAETLIAGGQR